MLKKKESYIALLAAVAIITGTALFTTTQGEMPKVKPKPVFSKWVNKEGNISLPKNYRLTWTHLGSWSLADGFHDVYTQKGNAEYYLEHGKFPEGAVLVKEVRGHKKGVKTTGQAQWAGEIIQWFVMVKNKKNQFPNNPLWGDGWGWALFKPADPTKQLAKGYKTDCMACHIPAANTDRVFIEGYPSLLK